MTRAKKRIIVAPLDWGLGHATRCIPIIRELQKREVEVMIATSGQPLLLLKQEFPTSTFFEIVSYKARYSRVWPFMLHLLWQLPRFLLAIRKEHRQLNKVISDHHIDLVISDNRYGAWSTRVPTIFITHQVSIILPRYLSWTKPLVDFVSHRQIKKFTECWIPDFPGSSVTGPLTSTVRIPMHFIGPLSRFTSLAQPAKKKYHVLITLSGPEPQRSELESILSRQLKKSSLTYRVILGKPGAPEENRPGYFNHVNTELFQQLIGEAEVVVARSGYSTIMDLMARSSRAIFIPTPGQTEQEFLAEELERKGIAYYEPQKGFDLVRALEKSKAYKGFAASFPPTNLLPPVLDNMLKKLE